jgi:hypothetical protein
VILVTPYLTEKGVGLTGADSSRPLLDSKIK